MAEKFLRIQGLKIHYIESGEAKAPKLLLLHGLGGSIESWKEVFGKLSENFHVTAIDLPGFGKSDRPLKPFTVDYLAEFICHFVRSTHFYPAILIGHSMGGITSIKAYLRCRESVDGMILIDVAGVSDVPVRKIREYMGEHWSLERLRRFYQECVLSRMDKFEEKRLEEAMRMLEDSKFLQLYLSLLDSISKPLSSSDLAEIKVPTLIIWGSDDRLAPLEDGIKLSQVIAGSRLIIIDGAGHSPHSEAPRQVIREIRDFVLKLKSS